MMKNIRNFALHIVCGITGLKFLLAPMGFIAPGSAHARPSAEPPIDTSGNFAAHVSAE